MPMFEIFFKEKDERVHIGAKTLQDAFEKMCELEGIGFIMKMDDDVTKELYVNGMTLTLIVKNKNPDEAIEELRKIKNVGFVTINAKRVHASVTFKVDGDQVKMAQELISQGWKWHDRYKADSCDHKDDLMRSPFHKI